MRNPSQDASHHQDYDNLFRGSRAKPIFATDAGRGSIPLYTGHTSCRLYGRFLKWWYPQNTPKWSFLVGQPMVAGETDHFRKPPYTYASRRMVMYLALQKIAGTICRSSLRGWLDEMHSRWLRLVTSPSPPGHVGKLRASANERKRRKKPLGFV